LKERDERDQVVTWKVDVAVDQRLIRELMQRTDVVLAQFENMPSSEPHPKRRDPRD
jgi:hypothetical protein